MQFQRVVPILRMFDVDTARAFYLDYLGCAVDFEHRFEPDLPLYMGISRGNLILHLSEHHGDGTPGTTIYVEMTGVHDLHTELLGKPNAPLRPGISEDEIGTSFELVDPFGNTLRFNERPAEQDASSDYASIGPDTTTT